MKAKEILSKVKKYMTGSQKENPSAIQTENLESLKGINELNELQSVGYNKSVPDSPFKIASQSISPECGYVEWGDKSFVFFVPQVISEGYKLVNRESYRLTISVDGHLLKLLSLIESKPSVIEVEDEAGNVVGLKGISKVSKIRLSGTVAYNSLLEGIEALHPLTENSQTKISQMGTVEINQILGYVCYACPEEENPLRNYSITLITDPNVMLILPERQITVLEGSDEFFELIDNPDIQRIIGRKYTLLVSPSPEPVS